jgi:hypothetical protein
MNSAQRLFSDRDVVRLTQQRDAAFFGAVLMFVLTGILVWNNFIRGYPALEREQAAVVSHRELLVTHQKILAEARRVVAANQLELEKITRHP